MSARLRESPPCYLSEELASSQMGAPTLSLEDRIRELAQKNLQLEEDKKRLTTRLTELESSLSLHDAEHATQRAEIQELQIKNKALEKRVQDLNLSTQSSTLDAEPKDKDESAKAYSPKRKDQKTQDLHLALEEKQRELDDKSQEFHQLTQQLLVLQEALIALEGSADKMLEKERAQAESYSQLEISHQREIKKLRGDVRDLQDQLDQNKDPSQTSASSVSDEQQPLAAQSLAIEFKEAGEYQKMKDEIDRLQTCKQALQAQINDLKSLLEKAQQELQASKTIALATTTFLPSEKETLTHLQSQHLLDQQLIQQLQEQLATEKEITKRLQGSEIQALKPELRQKISENDAIEKKIRLLEEQLQEKNNTILQLQTKLHALQTELQQAQSKYRELATLKEQLAGTDITIRSLTQEVVEQKRTMDQKEAQEARLQKQIAELKVTILQQAAELKSFQELNQLQLASITALTSQLAKSREALDVKTAELERVKDQHRREEKELEEVLNRPFYIKIKNGIAWFFEKLIAVILFPFKFIGRSLSIIKRT